jgi:hypothetical protein
MIRLQKALAPQKTSCWSPGDAVVQNLHVDKRESVLERLSNGLRPRGSEMSSQSERPLRVEAV